MRSFSLVPVGFAMLVLAFCVSPTPSAPAPTPTPAGPTAMLGQPVELALGDTAEVAETGLRVTPRTIVEDSRCPVDVTCVWSGRVVVEVEATASGEPTTSVRLASCCDPAEQPVADQTIHLRTVTPAPRRAAPIDPAAYRVTLVITRP
jgi:hypothetical protein